MFTAERPTIYRCGKDTGLNRVPSKRFAINQAWLACVLTAIDLLAWTQTILLHDEPDLAKAEPKTLRYRLLHVAAPTHARRTQTPPQDRPHLALGTSPDPRIPPPRRAAHSSDLTRLPRSDEDHGRPGTRARVNPHVRTRPPLNPRSSQGREINFGVDPNKQR